MRELEYPFDPGYIMKKRRSIKKELLKTDKPFIEKRIAVLGGSTTHDIIDILELFLLNAPKDCIFCVYEDDYFFTSKGKKLTESMMKNLLSQGEVKVSGFKSEKTGNTYNAVVSFADRTDKNGNAKIGFTMRFEDKKKR